MEEITRDVEFVFHGKPPAPADGRYRDACGGPARGLVYHRSKLGHDLHPCCAGLPETFVLAGLSFTWPAPGTWVPRASAPYPWAWPAPPRRSFR
ncbi:hypothetical protein C2845_PM05G03560 [Panicum miliaceum]|uniref:Uncharacterized protein n=1 Tax=Panicum miliaceum TaxID=4540 RepID=A0A3L6SZP9_PANMI|nr:hypothetical protein C2845_PM05G03560 [Panicum miliaceum]